MTNQEYQLKFYDYMSKWNTRQITRFRVPLGYAERAEQFRELGWVTLDDYDNGGVISRGYYNKYYMEFTDTGREIFNLMKAFDEL